ncbi:hypothetical protein OPV22_026574 [Ensete ventricosum]|uniref:Uncharacterized protein n=1 Tax=Ensete ventricosum TaxID=4639 RepID=A0AAV8P8L8_ENSVE|nr:hypothetical protein OPV22_026574 [Ensete ventricosum]RWW00981.1 hypothetical protein GW17_00036014 [Ensete ventricosum]RWW56610.1 hypothetical protein BHE74_00036660 [Ensete ventricosum]
MGTVMKTVVKIRQIVQLKQMMRRWRFLSLRRRQPEPDPEPDLQTDSASSRPVPSGFLAVYVGPERRRFVIPTRFLNLPVFAALLQRAEEEYGFQPAGGLSLPCNPAFFRWLLDALHRDEQRCKFVNLNTFEALFADLISGASSPCREYSTVSYNGFSPLLPKTKAR